MNKTFTVTVPEVHLSYMEVKADSPEDALEIVRNGGGDEVDIVYHETLGDSPLWDVKENEP